MTNGKTIHTKIAKEICKFLYSLSPHTINDIFKVRDNIYNFGNFQSLYSTKKIILRFMGSLVETDFTTNTVGIFGNF